jgi:hypothetical protein
MRSIYVNGVLAASGGNAAATGEIGQNKAHSIGRRQETATQYFDGYMADVNFVDGQSLTPSAFGQSDSNGVWTPKAYAGTFGTNGFRLDFSSGALTSNANVGLGKDVSGNPNYWNTNGISVTNDATYDQMTDTPLNNFATLNPLDDKRGSSPVDGNLSIAGTSSCKGTFFLSSGKWYFEFQVPSINGVPLVGIADATTPATVASGKFTLYRSDGGKQVDGSYGGAYGTAWANGDVIGIAYDADASQVTFYKNNTPQSTLPVSAGAGFPMVVQSTGGTYYVNFGQRPFQNTTAWATLQSS